MNRPVVIERTVDGAASRARALQVFYAYSDSAQRRAALRAPAGSIETNITFDLVRHRLAAARVVALPVLPNTYSGATTVLLQAMAMGRPIVVSRTKSAASGYGLAHQDNCLLVEPGDRDGFERAVRDLLSDERGAMRLGSRARDTAARSLSWRRYTDALLGLILEAAGRHRTKSP